MKSRFLATIAFCFALAAVPAAADDWPQWQGPERDGISKETGLLKEWPKDGPPLAWEVKGLGGGYSAPSVAAGRIFGMSYRGGDEVVWALDEKDGKEKWAATIGPACHDIGSPGSEGPRCTPTVDGDLVYALGTARRLVCLKTADGKEVWRKNLTKDFGGQFMAQWGYCESPLDRRRQARSARPAARTPPSSPSTRRPARSSGRRQVPDGNGAGYASPIAIDVGRAAAVRRISSKAAWSASTPATGKFLWRSAKGANARRQLRHADLLTTTASSPPRPTAPAAGW